jgi:hypothetical protein
MKNIQSEWRWEQGEVDEQQAYIELRHGNAGTTSYANWTPIALLAKPKGHVFKVKWLVQQVSADYKSMLADVGESLNFYLVEKGESDPWGYALYHCNTSSNLYSPVHWTYFPTGSQGKRQASRVIELSAEESVRIFGDLGKPGRFIEKG